MAILTDDVKTLSKAPGIGRKTAQRVILDLKDKCSTQEAISPLDMPDLSGAVQMDGAKFEAIEAMEALGYTRSEAAKAVNAVAGPDMDTGKIMKAALKKMITF